MLASEKVGKTVKMALQVFFSVSGLKVIESIHSSSVANMMQT
jgi:hypothetical protein